MSRAVILLIASVLFPMAAAHATEAEADSASALSLEDVVRLARGGVGDDVIIAKIQESGQSFHLTVDEILRLKRSGVNQGVLLELVRTGIRETHYVAKSEARELGRASWYYHGSYMHPVTPWPRYWYRPWPPVSRLHWYGGHWPRRYASPWRHHDHWW